MLKKLLIGVVLVAVIAVLVYTGLNAQAVTKKADTLKVNAVPNYGRLNLPNNVFSSLKGIPVFSQVANPSRLVFSLFGAKAKYNAGETHVRIKRRTKNGRPSADYEWRDWHGSGYVYPKVIPNEYYEIQGRWRVYNLKEKGFAKYEWVPDTVVRSRTIKQRFEYGNPTFAIYFDNSKNINDRITIHAEPVTH